RGRSSRSGPRPGRHGSTPSACRATSSSRSRPSSKPRCATTPTARSSRRCTRTAYGAGCGSRPTPRSATRTAAASGACGRSSWRCARPTTPTATRACRPAPSASRVARACTRRCTRPPCRTCTSSRNRTASTSFRRATPSTAPPSRGSGKCGAQRPRRRGRIASLPHRADHGDARRARAGEHGRRGRGDAPDRDHRHARRSEPREPGESLGSEGRAGVGFVGRGVTGPHAPVVRGPLAHPRRLGGRADGDAQQEPRRHVGAQAVERGVVLAEMRPRRARREGDVHAVVHEDGDRQRGDQGPHERRHLAGGGVFHPDLDQRRPAGHRPTAGRDRVAPLEKRGVCDHHQAHPIGERHEQSPPRIAGCHHRRREQSRSDPRGHGGAAARAPGGQRLPSRRRGERYLHVVPRPHGRVPGAGGAAARVDGGAAARRGGGRRARRPPPLHPRAAALLHHQAAARAETYVSARRGGAASRPQPMTRAAPGARTVAVTAKGAARWRGGHPWIYRADVRAEPGGAAGIVTVTDARGRHLGQALYSPRSEIRLRLLTPGREAIDAGWWAARIAAAAARRAGIPATAYRVVHAEGDGLPALVVDRYGPYAVAQLLSAGLECARNDAPIRRHEGLPLEVVTAAGTVPATVEVEEHGIRYLAAPHAGQKTGAFLDQRENRVLVAAHAGGGGGGGGGGRALDLFTYHGSFALHLAPRVREVLAVDASAEALARGRENAALNGFDNIRWLEANAFDLLRDLERRAEKFETIVLDPP